MKTKSFFIVAFFLTLIMSACGKKEIAILSPDVEGDLKGCFKIAETTCEVMKDEDGSKYIEVTLERTNESVPFTDKTVGVFGESNDALVLGGFGYEGYNANNEEIEDIDGENNQDYRTEQAAILKLAPGEKGTLKIKLKGEELPNGIILTSQLSFISTGEITLNGSIGKYEIKNFSIDFNFDTRKIIGQYQYKSSPAGAFLYLLGNIVTVDNMPGKYVASVYVAEDNGNGELTGKFKGQLILTRDSKTSPYYYILSGTFKNFRLQDFRYNLKSAPLNEIEYGSVLKNGYASMMNPSFVNEEFANFGFGGFAEEGAYLTSDDVSVDEFIRQYKNFFKKYIKVMKKVKNNDPTAILEYSELINQYQNLAEKAAQMESQMTPAQLNEINKMSQEIVSEMQNI